MGRYTICVYAICKNEEQFVDRWMDAVGEADMVVVTDTGSTDNTVQKLRGRGAVVYIEQITPWRFDTARNRSMDYIPPDVDICVCNDLDEVFEKGWRKKLEDAWKPEYTRARYLFNYSLDENGAPIKQYTMEKIHRRHDFRWVHPVHEVLEYSGSDPDRSVWVDMTLNHYPDAGKSRGQYLPLLELSAQENPLDDRAAFWLGREYLYHAQYDKAIRQLKRHLALPTARWAEERCASMRCMASAYENMAEPLMAKRWLLRAIAECGEVREPYYDLLKLSYHRREWTLAAAMTECTLAITQKSGSYLTNEAAWGTAVYDYGAIACYHIGLYQRAYLYIQAACKLCPDDKRLQQNRAIIAEKCNEKGE